MQSQSLIINTKKITNMLNCTSRNQNHLKNVSVIGLLCLGFIFTIFANHHAYCQGMQESNDSHNGKINFGFNPAISNFCFIAVLNLVMDILILFFGLGGSAFLQQKLPNRISQSSYFSVVERSCLAILTSIVGLSFTALMHYVGTTTNYDDMYELTTLETSQCHDIEPSFLPAFTSLCLIAASAFFTPSPFPTPSENASPGSGDASLESRNANPESGDVDPFAGDNFLRMV